MEDGAEKRELGIFVPAYEAGQTLDTLLRRIPEAVWEKVKVLAVIDDGSHDETSQIVRHWMKKKKEMVLERFPENRGYGAAVRRGLAICRQENCKQAVCLHADGQYPPEQIMLALQTMSDRGWDLLQGSRHLGGTALQGGMPLYKYLAGKWLTLMENFCFGIRLTDYHSGFLVYHENSLQLIPFEKLSGYFDFDLEVIATACAKGLKVGEMAIPTRYAGEISHLNPWRYGVHVLVVLLRYLRGHYARL